MANSVPKETGIKVNQVSQKNETKLMEVQKRN